jgi:uncharacterized circularly permuted ATP-grasp superfamily protein
MKTTSGLHDVIYRRLDDEYLDPLVLRPDGLRVPGLMRL